MKMDRKNKIKRVLIIHPEGNTFNNPSMQCIVDLFLEKGVEVDLRYQRYLDIRMSSTKGLRLIPYGRWRGRFQSIIGSLPFFLISKCFMFLLVCVDSMIHYRKYNLIIGVDRLGGVEAGLLHQLIQTPYVFISFEITFEHETSFKYKLLERNLLKNISAWIVQDEERAKQLQCENNLDLRKKILLPLASKGVGDIERTCRLRDTLNIPKNKKVAIVIGSISNWSMTHEIIESAISWPDDWALIVHERYGKAHELIGEHIRFRKNIFCSNVSEDKVDRMGKVFSGIAVGLAFYSPQPGRHWRGYYIGDNLKYLGLSSGKISTYLRYGVPVIMNNIGVYSDEAEKFQFGCVVNDPKEIKTYLGEVMNEKYHKNAKEYYLKHLDFNNYRKILWSNFMALM